MFFMEIIAVNCENHMEHTDVFWGRMQRFIMLKGVVHIVTTVP
jgi:hypothetical protein